MKLRSKVVSAVNTSNTLIKACKMLNTTHPHVLEFGVASGNTLSQIIDSVSQNYSIFGFDSWLGLPEDWRNSDGECSHHKGIFSTGGKLPPFVEQLQDKAKIFNGWFEETIPEYLKIAENIALLHVDCDIYSSTKTVLNSLIDYIKSGTLIVFDEWFDNQEIIRELPVNTPIPAKYSEHEQKAFYEWVKDFNVKFRWHNSEYGFYGLEIEKQLIEIISVG
jgi:hypothetical protein